MKTVAVIEGFAGGPYLSRTLRRDLVGAGFELIKNKAEANVIIAHSGGCYDLPPASNAQLFMLINPPYWPNKSIVSRWIRKEGADTKRVRRDYGFRYLLKLKVWEGIYIFLKPSYALLALRDMSLTGLLDHIRERKIILIRNHMDYFCTPAIKEELTSYKNVKYVELPGEHDDYYTNPKPYIDLLLKEL